MNELLQQAQTALQSGQKPQAQTLIAQALKANPRDAQAWLLLEQCVEPLERKKYCLQQVFLINPQNPQARQRLAELEPPPQPDPPPPSPTPSVDLAVPEPSPNSFATLAEPEDEFETLEPDSPPTVTGLEAALMDDASFKPSPFALPLDEIRAIDTDQWQAEPIASQSELETLDSESSIEETSAPLSAEPPTPAPAPLLDKAAIRSTLEQGVALIERGNKIEGVPMLEAVVTADSKNETAWLWLGAAADDDQHKRDYFLKALEINPRNKLARDLLKPVEARLGAEVSLPAEDDETKPTKRTNRNGLIALIMIVLLILVIVLIAIRMFR